MDAFSVSLANGLNEPEMRRRKSFMIAGTFAFFQAFMPMTGWICVHTIVTVFSAFERFVPWIALILLLFIGGKMIFDSVSGRTESEDEAVGIGFSALILQGIATSIDALSVGFTIAEYEFPSALSASLIIAAVTFIICMAGLAIGRKFGTKLAGKAQILGGVILIAIGIEIFVSGLIS
ncbi:MAG: manganese efflux pump [Ruminiclostridium sp.]|nr:manganese efflux pump [Ruminiclostridium sp.]